MRLVIRLCLLLPYNAAIFSTNVRFPLCSLVCLFGKVVLFFWRYDERFISPEYLLQVCAIFDTTCSAHLVILPACHIYRSCVIFSIYYYYFFPFSFMRILFELCLFSIHIPPNVNHPMHYGYPRYWSGMYDRTSRRSYRKESTLLLLSHLFLLGHLLLIT